MHPGNQYNKQAHEVLNRIQLVMRSRPALVSCVHPIHQLVTQYLDPVGDLEIGEDSGENLRILFESDWDMLQSRVTRALTQVDLTIDSLKKSQ